MGTGEARKNVSIWNAWSNGEDGNNSTSEAEGLEQMRTDMAGSGGGMGGDTLVMLHREKTPYM